MRSNRLIFVCMTSYVTIVLWGAGCAQDKPDAATSSNVSVPPARSTNAPPASAAKTGGQSDGVAPGNIAATTEKAGANSGDASIPAKEASKATQNGSGKTPSKVKSKVVTTPSGLQYEDVIVGKGPMPKNGQTVVVDYIGTLSDGTEFDSSLSRSQPFAFPLGLGKVIRGWDEGIATMHVGGKRWLTIPPELGYGPAGQPPKIPPAATLTFLVKLLKIQ